MTEPSTGEATASPASDYFQKLRALRPDEHLTMIIDRVEEEMMTSPQTDDRLAKYAKRDKK